MNYLAHIYLSGGDPEVTVGNFMADAVKGKDYQNYSEGIQRGIILHRAIDTFTDSPFVSFFISKFLALRSLKFL